MNDHSTMIEDCENRDSRLSNWERDFIASIKEQLEAGRTLTDRQAETLENIWEKVT